MPGAEARDGDMALEFTIATPAEDALPKDAFLSVRIGETQKLARLPFVARVFRFPREAALREFAYGRVEVFQRLGSCIVDVNPQNRGQREIQISCVGVGAMGTGPLGFSVALDTPRPHTDHVADTALPGAVQPVGKVTAAKEYLNQHGVEAQFFQAMQALLKQRPASPLEFLAFYFASASADIQAPRTAPAGDGGVRNRNARGCSLQLCEGDTCPEVTKLRQALRDEAASYDGAIRKIMDESAARAEALEMTLGHCRAELDVEKEDHQMDLEASNAKISTASAELGSKTQELTSLTSALHAREEELAMSEKTINELRAAADEHKRNFMETHAAAGELREAEHRESAQRLELQRHLDAQAEAACRAKNEHAETEQLLAAAQASVANTAEEAARRKAIAEEAARKRAEELASGVSRAKKKRVSIQAEEDAPNKMSEVRKAELDQERQRLSAETKQIEEERKALREEERRFRKERKQLEKQRKAFKEEELRFHTERGQIEEQRKALEEEERRFHAKRGAFEDDFREQRCQLEEEMKAIKVAKAALASMPKVSNAIRKKQESLKQRHFERMAAYKQLNACVDAELDASSHNAAVG
mmetsp:Transcript_39292/g.108347  ORF Transcript_39292/g.108347 Transcript_39292/m.108347 type:complete len:591 (-) Transcript_39292:84-1856(-)